jgi:hypothetical protein
MVLVHVLDLPSKIQEAPPLAAGYVGIVAVALLLMQQLMYRQSSGLFLVVGGLAATVGSAFVLTRTVGLPMATDDIGNWTEPLGLASLLIDSYLVVQAAVAISALRQPGPRARGRRVVRASRTGDNESVPERSNTWRDSRSGASIGGPNP